MAQKLKFTELQIGSMVLMYEKDKFGIRCIAKKIGASTTTVRYWLLKRGVKIDKGSRVIVPGKRKQISDPKKCCSCHIDMPLSEFADRAGTYDGKASRCRFCEATRRSKASADVSSVKRIKKQFSGYAQMLAAQSGKCAICEEQETAKSKVGVRALCVDHCHKTGRVRGLLCSRCNMALGHFRDELKYIENALKYLSLDYAGNAG